MSGSMRAVMKRRRLSIHPRCRTGGCVTPGGLRAITSAATTTQSEDVPSAVPSEHGEHCLAQEDGKHDRSDRSAPEPSPTGDTADAGGLRGVPGARVPVGAPAALPDLRARGLLRFLAASARARARLRGRAPDRRVFRAGRVLALVLCQRSLRLSLRWPCPGTLRRPLTCRERIPG